MFECVSGGPRVSASVRFVRGRAFYWLPPIRRYPWVKLPNRLPPGRRSLARIPLRDPLQLVGRQRSALGSLRPRLGTIEERCTSTPINIGELGVAVPFIEPDPEIGHRRELVLANAGDRLGVFAPAGMGATGGGGC